MAIVVINGQNVPIDDETASDDNKLRQALASSYPIVSSASIERKTTRDNKLRVEVVNPPRTEGANGVADLEKAQQHTQIQPTDSTSPQDGQQETEERSADEPTAFSPAWYPLQSRAIGLVQGQYFPSASDLIEGVLVLDDGTIAPTNFLASSIRYLKKNLFLLESPQLWIVYPSTSQEPPYLRFTIKGVKTPEKEANIEAIRSQKDYFSVRGLITHIDEQAGQFVVRIFRSDREIVPEEVLSQNYFLTRIKGILAKDAFGQFGDLSVKREGDKLVLKDFQFVQRLLQPKKQKRAKKRSRRKGKSTTNGSSTSSKSQEQDKGQTSNPV